MLQIVDLGILGQHFPLVGLDVVQEYSFLALSTPIRSHGLLESLQKLILCVVQILDKGPHSFNLRVQALALLLFGGKVFLGLA